MVDSVDEGCGYPVDNVDNCVNIRAISAFFACGFVDNPVETVDDTPLWLCITIFYNCEYGLHSMQRQLAEVAGGLHSAVYRPVL